MGNNFYYPGRALSLQAKSGNINVEIDSLLSHGQEKTVMVATLVKCPKAVRAQLPRRIVLKMHDRRNAAYHRALHASWHGPAANTHGTRKLTTRASWI